MRPRRAAPTRETLAMLAVPAPGSVSRWHRPRPSPSLGELVQRLRDRLDAEVLAVDATHAVLVVDAGDGRTVQVRLSPGRAELNAVPAPREVYDEEHGEWLDDEDADAPVEAAAGRVLEVLQPVTGWYVDSDRLLGFEPDGACAACQAELFVWQEECGVCQHRRGARVEREPVHAARARRLVDALLAADTLVLTSPAARARLERRLATCFERRIDSSERILGVLESSSDVDEVYVDAAALSRVLQKIG